MRSPWHRWVATVVASGFAALVASPAVAEDAASGAFLASPPPPPAARIIISRPSPLVPVTPQAAAARQATILGFVMVGMAGVSALVGTVYAGLAVANKGAAGPDGTASSPGGLGGDGLIAIITLGVGLSLSVTGTAIILCRNDSQGCSRGDPLPTVSRRVFVSPQVGTTGGGAVAGLRF